MTIPNFKSQEHQEEYELLFAEKAVQYVKLMDVVKELMFGPKCVYNNLPGQCLEVVRDITQSLLYDTEYTFCQRYPEYDKDRLDDVFIPRRTFKEDVTEALLEANQKFWNSSNEPTPLQYNDLHGTYHLTDE